MEATVITRKEDVPEFLSNCGVVINEAASFENRALLSIAARKLQMSCFLSPKNANRLIFRWSATDDMRVVVSSDVPTDEKVMPLALILLGGHMRRYIGLPVSLVDKSQVTMVLYSPDFALISNKDLLMLWELVRMMEDRYEARAIEEAKVCSSTLVTCSVLLSNLRTYLTVATSLRRKVKAAFEEEAGGRSFLSALTPAAFGGSRSTPAERLQHYALSLQATVEHLSESMGRISCVASHYSEPDKKKYYLSCFQFLRRGLVGSLNETLLELSRLVPTHRLVWEFRLDPQLAARAHRTFYQHLLFFLEGIVLRWAAVCDSMLVTVDYQSAGSFRGAKNPESRLDLGHLQLAFQPLGLSLDEEDVTRAAGSSRALVTVLSDFLRRIDSVARAEIVDGAGSGKTNSGSQYLVTLPCHFHQSPDWAAVCCNTSASMASIYREATVVRHDEWVEDERPCLLSSREVSPRSMRFCVQTEPHSRRKSVVSEAEDPAPASPRSSPRLSPPKDSALGGLRRSLFGGQTARVEASSPHSPPPLAADGTSLMEQVLAASAAAVQALLGSGSSDSGGPDIASISVSGRSPKPTRSQSKSLRWSGGWSARISPQTPRSPSFVVFASAEACPEYQFQSVS